MKKNSIFVILLIIWLSANNFVFATDLCCPESNIAQAGNQEYGVNYSETLEEQNKTSDEALKDNQIKTEAEKEKDKTTVQEEEEQVEEEIPDELTESLFDYTKSQASVEIVNGVPVYTIHQNGDTRFNVGYVLGKRIMLHDNDYANKLRNFIDYYNQEQSEYKLNDVVSNISKSLPCWFKNEMLGLAAALSINKEKVKISYNDIVTLNTVALWSRLLTRPPQEPPAAPTSITPLKKDHKKEEKLSPVKSVSANETFAISLDTTQVAGGNALVARTYSRVYNDFFNKTAAIMVYDLDNKAFINVGFAGLVSVLSAMNQEGVVINSIQDAEQENIKIWGTTPPSIVARVAIESADNAEQAQKVLENYYSSIEQTYLVTDPIKHLLVKSTFDAAEEVDSYTKKHPGRTIVYNYPLATNDKKMREEYKFISEYSEPVSFESLMVMFSSDKLFNTTSSPRVTKKKTSKSHVEPLNTVFNAIYSPEKRTVWAIMPDETQVEVNKDYIEITFQESKIFDTENIQPEIIKNTNEEFYDKYLNNQEANDEKQ
jgi:hypothetical protein